MSISKPFVSGLVSLVTLTSAVGPSFATSIVDPTEVAAKTEKSGAPEVSTPVKPLKPGNRTIHIRVGKKKRAAVVHIPKGYAADKSVPLILVLHGGLGNSWSAEYDSQMSKRADKDGFIVAYPRGTGRTDKHFLTWNAGSCCGIAMRRQIDDVAFLRELILEMESKYNVDKNRVYIAGLSNGGMLAYRAGLELSDLVAAIAPVEGCMMYETKTAGYPVSVIAFHGTGDETVPYDGGDGGIPGYKLIATNVKDNIKYWVTRNHCAVDPEREESGEITKEIYHNGEAGTEVCLYTIKGGNHSWPGGRTALFFINVPNPHLSATDAMCDFFWKHPKQSTPATIGSTN